MTVESVPFILPTALDLIEFGWDEESISKPDAFLRPLLSCGHYDRPTFVGSSQWDFPADEHACPTCDETVQWDVQVQDAVYRSWEES